MFRAAYIAALIAPIIGFFMCWTSGFPVIESLIVSLAVCVFGLSIAIMYGTVEQIEIWTKRTRKT